MDLAPMISNNSVILITVLVVLSNFRNGLGELLGAQSFPCGPSGLRCNRVGYDACLYRNGEYYCLPCSQNYLKSLCGTQNETYGCNSYCTQLVVDKKTEKLKSEYSKQLANLNANCSLEKADLRSEMEKTLENLQNKLYFAQSEKVNLTKQIKSLEHEKATHEPGKAMGLYVFGFWTLLGITKILVVILIVLCRRCRKRKRTGIDCEEPEETKPLTKLESGQEFSDHLDEREKKENKNSPLPAVFNKEAQVELLPRDDCPCYNKLNGVNPTVTDPSVEETGTSQKHKIAIRDNEHDCQQQTRF